MHHLSYILFALIGAAAGYLVDGYRGGLWGAALIVLSVMLMSFAAKTGKWLVIAMAVILLAMLFYFKYSIQSS